MAINPLQLPGYAAPQTLDFSQLGNLGKVYQQAQADQARKQTLADLGSGTGALDYSAAARASLAAGDLPTAMTLATLGSSEAQKQVAAQRDQRDFAFKQQESQRAQQNSDRTFAASQETKPVLKTVKNIDGSESLVRVGADGKSVPVDTGPQATSNPFSYGKMNENQSKDSGYANRMFRAEGVLRDPEVVDAGTSLTQQGLGAVPVAGNYLTSPQYQKYDQASRDFINAVLRRESGAAISSSEFDNAYKQYLPRPGDSKERLAEKQKNRQVTLASIAGGGGPAYKPPFTFGQNGEMVPTGNQQQGVLPPKSAPAPSNAVDALRANPSLAAQFDQKYGAGSAAALLGGQ